MFNSKNNLGHRIFRKSISTLLTFFFSFTLIFPPSIVQAQNISGFNLPLPGTFVTQTPGFVPSLIKGIEIHPENPFQFDFIIDTGENKLSDDKLRKESLRMVKYFLAALTTPEEDMWVNLSPYEEDRVVPESFGRTGMGIDLLAEDYLLKQLTASMVYPEKDLGKKFWKRVYARAYKEYGVKNVPLDSFHKVWIVARDAEVVQMGNRAFVINSSMEVLTEEDYFARQNNQVQERKSTGTQEETTELTQLQTEVMREVVIPEIEKEVNQGAHFAKLRQIYNAMILATWFKITLKESILGKMYVDQNKTPGVDTGNPQWKDEIYNQYLEAFRKGVYDYIREEPDAENGQLIARRYFSGGASPNQTKDGAMLSVAVRDQMRALKDTAGMLGEEYLATMKELKQEVLTALKPKEDDTPLRSVTVNLLNPADDGTGGDAAMVANLLAPEDLLEKIHQRYPKVPEFKDDDFLKALSTVLNNHRGFIYNNLTLEAVIPELRPEVQRALGKGGLGFLDGETSGATTTGIGYMPVYDTTQDGIHIDWDNEKGIYQFTGADGKQVVLNVQMAGKTYKVKVYWINRNGRIVFGFRNAEIFDRLYPDPEYGSQRMRQYGFLGKAYVELENYLGINPDILRLNEAQMLFVKKAVENDVKEKGKESVFYKTKTVMTNHTPERAALPTLRGDRGWLTGILGDDLVTDELYQDELGKPTNENGYPVIQMAERLAQKSDLILTVAEEHGEVTKRHVLPEFAWKTTYVQNGSDPWQWYTDFLAEKVKELGGYNNIDQVGMIPGEDIFNNKQNVQKPLLNAWLKDNEFNQFTDLNRPLFGAVRRLVEYKEQGILFAMLDWITGDPDKEYDVPVSGWPAERRKGLGANLLIGGPESGQAEWAAEFRRLANDERYKGKMVFIDKTGTDIMQLAVSASDFWLVTPRPTREASGTSDERALFNGTLVIASATGGPLEMAGHDGIRLVDIFGVQDKGFDKDWEEIVKILDNPNHPAYSSVVERYRTQAQLMFGQYMQEYVDMYNDRKNGKLFKEMEEAFYWGHKKFAIDRMVSDLEDVFEHVLDGTGAAGYEVKQIPATKNSEVIEKIVRVLRANYALTDEQSSVFKRFLEGRGSAIDAINMMKNSDHLSAESAKQVVLSAWIAAANNLSGLDALLSKTNIVSSGYKKTVFEKQLGDRVEVGNSQQGVLENVIDFEQRLRDIDREMAEGREIAPDAQHLTRKELAKKWTALKETLPEQRDAAMVAKTEGTKTTDAVNEEAGPTGGIDFNAGYLNLKIRRDDNGMPLPVTDQPMQELMQIPGLTPVIINVTPIQSLPAMLGLEDEPQDNNEVSFVAQADLMAKLD